MGFRCPSPRYLSAGTVESLVSMVDAVSALKRFLLQPPLPQAPRSIVNVSSGQLLLMPAQSAQYVGVKIATVAPANPAAGLERIQGVYVLQDAATLRPVALLDGVALTNIRTPAVSALSADYLAVPDARTLVVFGTGPQAWGHVLAMLAVRPLHQAYVVGRSPERVQALVQRISGLGLPASAASAEAVQSADIVCTCTSAREPLFDGRLLPRHAHVAAVGSHEPAAREVDAVTVSRAQVIVEDRHTAMREAGDVIVGLREAGLGVNHVRADLPELVAGAAVDQRRLSLFKSVGMAWQDLAVAEVVYERYRAQAS